MAAIQSLETSVRREKAVLAALLPKDPRAYDADPLDELRGLAQAAGAVVVDVLTQVRDKPSAHALMGKGKIEELGTLVKRHGAMVVIFENDLSPSQIRNIEQVVGCKVLDRSELILDIFASRARTHEAKLQVELAQLEYTYPRLRAMWDHLERIAGGAPAGIGTRGPGEQQLEIDRRIVQRRKADLKRQIQEVQRRKSREVEKRNVDFFTVGLVGYTNAGKSTLFNTMTGAGVYVADQVFATLDTRTKKVALGGGDDVMLSDTVGFVRDLPHHLVASFRATLEEAVNADLLLLVIDVSDPDAHQHLRTVGRVLDDIGADRQPRQLILNKVDLLDDNAELLIWTQEHPGAIGISAAQGTGLDTVVEAIRTAMRGTLERLTLRVPMAEGRALQFLETRSEIHDRRYDANHVDMEVTIGVRQIDQLRAMGARFEVLGA